MCVHSLLSDQRRPLFISFVLFGFRCRYLWAGSCQDGAGFHGGSERHFLPSQHWLPLTLSSISPQPSTPFIIILLPVLFLLFWKWHCKTLKRILYIQLFTRSVNHKFALIKNYLNNLKQCLQIKFVVYLPISVKKKQPQGNFVKLCLSFSRSLILPPAPMLLSNSTPSPWPRSIQ